MGERRKLQGEIERVLKRVGDGIDTFNEIWNKVDNSSTVNQKEKHEQELKREIKKLQRFRDQIKTWLTSNEVKDKALLTDARRRIENLMERFKVIEKETKTKAYSKEGLETVQKIDPQQQEKDSAIQWISKAIESLKIQTDAVEAEKEAILVSFPKKKRDSKEAFTFRVQKSPRIGALSQRVTRNKFHIQRLETILRLVNNDALAIQQVLRMKSDVDYYISNNRQSDFLENENIYDEICSEETRVIAPSETNPTQLSADNAPESVDNSTVKKSSSVNQNLSELSKGKHFFSSSNIYQINSTSVRSLKNKGMSGFHNHSRNKISSFRKSRVQCIFSSKQHLDNNLKSCLPEKFTSATLNSAPDWGFNALMESRLRSVANVVQKRVSSAPGKGVGSSWLYPTTPMSSPSTQQQSHGMEGRELSCHPSTAEKRSGNLIQAYLSCKGLFKHVDNVPCSLNRWWVSHHPQMDRKLPLSHSIALVHRADRHVSESDGHSYGEDNLHRPTDSAFRLRSESDLIFTNGCPTYLRCFRRECQRPKRRSYNGVAPSNMRLGNRKGQLEYPALDNGNDNLSDSAVRYVNSSLENNTWLDSICCSNNVSRYSLNCSIAGEISDGNGMIERYGQSNSSRSSESLNSHIPSTEYLTAPLFPISYDARVSTNTEVVTTTKESEHDQAGDNMDDSKSSDETLAAPTTDVSFNNENESFLLHSESPTSLEDTMTLVDSVEFYNQNLPMFSRQLCPERTVVGDEFLECDEKAGNTGNNAGNGESVSDEFQGINLYERGSYNNGIIDGSVELDIDNETTQSRRRASSCSPVEFVMPARYNRRNTTTNRINQSDAIQKRNCPVHRECFLQDKRIESATTRMEYPTCGHVTTQQSVYNGAMKAQPSAVESSLHNNVMQFLRPPYQMQQPIMVDPSLLYLPTAYNMGTAVDFHQRELMQQSMQNNAVNSQHNQLHGQLVNGSAETAPLSCNHHPVGNMRPMCANQGALISFNGYESGWGQSLQQQQQQQGNVAIIQPYDQFTQEISKLPTAAIMRDNAYTIPDQFNRIEPNVNNPACYLQPPNYQLPLGAMPNQQLPFTNNVLQAMMAGAVGTRPECNTTNQSLVTSANINTSDHQYVQRPHPNMWPTLHTQSRDTTVLPPPPPLASAIGNPFNSPSGCFNHSLLDQTSSFNMNDTNEKFRLFHEIALIEEERAKLKAKHEGYQAAKERMQQFEFNMNSLRSLYQHRAQCVRAAMRLGSYDVNSAIVDDKSSMTDVNDEV